MQRVMGVAWRQLCTFLRCLFLSAAGCRLELGDLGFRLGMHVVAGMGDGPDVYASQHQRPARDEPGADGLVQ